MVQVPAYLSYKRMDETLCYLKSTHNHEVDFIVGTKVAIEVKSIGKLIADDFKGLKALHEENIFDKYLMVSQDKKLTSFSNFLDCYHYEEFLNLLWNDKRF